MAEESNNQERILRGIAASPGVAHGLAFSILQREHEVPIYEVEEIHRSQEVARFEQALLATRHQISNVRSEVSRRLGEDEAKIFDAHLMVLEDKALIDEVISELEQTGYNIEYCFHSVCQRFIEAFSTLQDEYIKERVMDIRDVAKRVLDNLMGESCSSLAELTAERVIVSEDISPSDAADLEKARVLAILTDSGSRTSHAVIMARSLQIPAVVGMHNVTKQIETGDYVLVDGYEGLVILNPSEDTLFRYGQLKKERLSIEKIYRTEAKETSVTLDKKPLPIMANIGSLEDCHNLKGIGAEGVGLFRTEALFMRADGFPSEEEQYEVYKNVARALHPLPVIIRTLDLGGDKYTSEMTQGEPEANPFMGFRAIRFCLEHQDIFKEQLRAILRASAHGDVRVMFPMISGVEELLIAKALLEEARQEVEAAGQAYARKLQIGSMIEIPSAAMTADLLAEHCDFFSIGTNDLIQYTLAVDRVNDRIAHLYNPAHPAVIRTLARIMEGAKTQGIPVGICGELASDPWFVPLLFGLGAHELSVNSTSIPEIKYLVRHMALKDACAMAKEVLKERDPAAIYARLEAFYQQLMGDVLRRHAKGKTAKESA